MKNSITIAGLSKQYKAVRALDRISLTVRSGELFGLLGVNGAGKTTLIKILSGLTKPCTGEAQIEGFSVFREPERIKPRIAAGNRRCAQSDRAGKPAFFCRHLR